MTTNSHVLNWQLFFFLFWGRWAWRKTRVEPKIQQNVFAPICWKLRVTLQSGTCDLICLYLCVTVRKWLTFMMSLLKFSVAAQNKSIPKTFSRFTVVYYVYVLPPRVKVITVGMEIIKSAQAHQLFWNASLNISSAIPKESVQSGISYCSCHQTLSQKYTWIPHNEPAVTRTSCQMLDSNYVWWHLEARICTLIFYMKDLVDFPATHILTHKHGLLKYPLNYWPCQQEKTSSSNCQNSEKPNKLTVDHYTQIIVDVAVLKIEPMLKILLHVIVLLANYACTYLLHYFIITCLTLPTLSLLSFCHSLPRHGHKYSLFFIVVLHFPDLDWALSFSQRLIYLGNHKYSAGLQWTQITPYKTGLKFRMRQKFTKPDI